MFGFGKKFRVIKESLQTSKGDFESTNTERCKKLVDQLAPLEKHLKKYLRELNAFKASARELMGSTRAVLSVPSPTPGDTETTSTTALGYAVDMDPMTSVDESRLSTTVIAPCERWLAEFHIVKGERMSILEKVRLELDSRRREEIELKDTSSRLEGQIAPTDPAKREKHERSVQEAQQRLAHKSQKLQGVAKMFEEQEAAIYQNLVALSTDTALMPAYMAGTLTVFKDIFGNAVEAFPYESRQIPAVNALESGDHHEMWQAASKPISSAPTQANPFS